MEEKIIRLIASKGPLTGSEVWKEVGGEALPLWRTCKSSKNLVIHNIGRRYLRLDRRVEGFARLSPSIWREFLTYSIIGLKGDPGPLEQRGKELIAHIEGISRAKAELAYQVVSGLGDRLSTELPLDQGACFIIGGDISYNMAHDVPRPERSTKKLVNGSDMDIVVIVDDHFPEDLMKRLDNALYEEKYRLLITPHIREEIDYIVKKPDRVLEQVRFSTFKHMIACKILQEGTLLYGSETLFHNVKTMLRDHGVLEKLADLEKRAKVFRANAERVLLATDPYQLKEDELDLFYPSEESEEFD